MLHIQRDSLPTSITSFKFTEEKRGLRLTLELSALFLDRIFKLKAFAVPTGTTH
jgi:hypothetical protein